VEYRRGTRHRRHRVGLLTKIEHALKTKAESERRVAFGSKA